MKNINNVLLIEKWWVYDELLLIVIKKKTYLNKKIKNNCYSLLFSFIDYFIYFTKHKKKTADQLFKL